MKAKSILDAVIEFKGEWPNGCISSLILSGNEFFIEEFNQEVKEYSNNRGWENIKQDSKAVYTGGELRVGMDVIVNSKNERLIDFNNAIVNIIGISKHSDGDDIFTFENSWYGVGCSTIHSLKAIDTRSDKEKTIDDIFNCTIDIPTWRKKSEVIFNEIKSGKILGVSFTGSDS